MYENPKTLSLVWQKNKKRPSYLTDQINQDKKDGKLPPNAFFKTSKKNKLLTLYKMMPEYIYTTKKGKISPCPRMSLID